MDWIIFTALLTAFVAVGTFLVWALVHADMLIRGQDRWMERRRRQRARRAADQLARHGYVVVLHEPVPERDRDATRAVEDWYGE